MSHGDAGSLGAVSESGPTTFKKAGGTRVLTITLNQGATLTDVENFLRSFTFSTSKMDPKKGPLGRNITVQVFDRSAGQGTPSNVVTTQIRAFK